MSIATVKGKGALVGMIADLAITTSNDKSLDFLSVIQLHTDGGKLHGWSTDRYRAAHAAVVCEGELPGPIEIRAPEVSTLPSLFRAALEVDLTLGDGVVKFSSPGGPEVTVSAATPDPSGSVLLRMHHIAVDELPEGGTAVGFDAKYLAGYAKIAQRRKEYLQLVAATDRKPAHIGIGPDYRSWLMPIRGGQDHDWSWLKPNFASEP